nr:hypothetical protein [Tanacetum cinerariifolium]
MRFMERSDMDKRMVAEACKEMMQMFKGKNVNQSNVASTSKPHASIKRSRRDLSSDGVINLAMTSGRGRLKRGSRIIYVATTLPFPKSNTRSLVPFELLHVDLWGTYKTSALNGARYFFTIVDDNSRCAWTYLVHTKDQVLSILYYFLAYIGNHFNAKLKFLRSDNGTEIVNKECLAYLKICGSVHQKSMVYTSQQNAVVERKRRHLLDTARDLKFHDAFLDKFWIDCVLTDTFLINKMLMKIFDWKSPFEVLHGTSPSYNSLRTIGCLCYATGTKPHKDKFAPRSVKCVLTGYPPRQKADENDHIPNTPDERTIDEPEEPYAKVLASVEHVHYSQASADSKWVESMNKELQALKTNDTWTLTTLPYYFTRSTKGHFFNISVKEESLTMALVYVDDILIIGNNDQDIMDTKLALDKKSTIKDLGLARYFLGIKLCRTANRTHLHQK